MSVTLRGAAAGAAAGVFLAAALGLAGCTPGGPGGPGASGTASSSTAAGAGETADPGVPADGGDIATPDPELTPAQPAYSVDELRALVSSSGYDCTTFTPATIDAGNGGWCQESMIGVFAFPDQAGVDTVVERSQQSAEPRPFLVGNRWLITIDDPASGGEELNAMQDIIGGSLVGLDL